MNTTGTIKHYLIVISGSVAMGSAGVVFTVGLEKLVNM